MSLDMISDVGMSSGPVHIRITQLPHGMPAFKGIALNAEPKLA